MTKYPDLPPERRQQYIDGINRRWKQLHDLEAQWGERAYKYLLLTNSGGAVAILSFLGTDSARHIFWAKAALVCFVLGLIFMGIEIARRVHFTENLYSRYRDDASAFFAGDMDFNALDDADEARSRKPPLLAYVLPYICFFLFIAGAAIAGYALFDAPSPRVTASAAPSGWPSITVPHLAFPAAQEGHATSTAIASEMS